MFQISLFTNNVKPTPTGEGTPVKAHLRNCGIDLPAEKLGRQTLVLDNCPKGQSLFITAIERAFMDHIAFGIRPEVLMYLINHEVATTVNRNPDKYRALFTNTTEGKTKVVVRDDTLAEGQDCDWDRTICLFDKELRKYVPDGIMNHMLPTFTTNTVETAAASLVCFMDAAKSFYDYTVMTRCGIPSVTLFGEQSDYTKVLNAATALREVFSEDLGPYFDNLLPVLKQIRDEFGAKTPDMNFWKSIYKYRDGSGGPYITGWITTFFAYRHRQDWRTGKALCDLRESDDLSTCMKEMEWGGFQNGNFPAHVSSVPFIWDYYGDRKEMTFCGGVLSVENDNGALTPGLSYAVLKGQNKA